LLSRLFTVFFVVARYIKNKRETRGQQAVFFEKQGIFLEKQGTFLRKDGTFLRKQGTFLRKNGTFCNASGRVRGKRGLLFENEGKTMNRGDGTK